MPTNDTPLSISPKKPPPHEWTFGLEITLAVLVKFLLLAGLWWLFFAGQKKPMNEAIIAKQLLGEQSPPTTVYKPQEQQP